MAQRPVNGTRSEYPMIGMERRVADLEQRTRQIPSRIRNNGGTGANSITRSVTQVAHGFTAGKVVGLSASPGVWVLAAANGSYDYIGLVVSATADAFVVCLEGEASYTGATVDALHYIYAAGAGNVTTTRPTNTGLNYIRAVFYGLTSQSVYVLGTALILSHDHEFYNALGIDPTTRPGVTGGPTGGEVLTYDSTTQLYKALAPSAAVADNSITNAKLRDSAGVSVIGRAANTTGDPADIVAAANGDFLRRKANVVAFGAIAADDLGASPVAGKLLLATSATAQGWFAMSGDATIDAAGALALANSGVAAGGYGAANTIPTFTVDAKGRVLSVTNVAASVTLAGDVSGPSGATVIGAGKVLAAMIGNNQVGSSQLAQAAGYTVLGNTTNALANVSGITASADGQTLVRRSGTLEFRGLNIDELADVTLTSRAANDVLVDNGTIYENKTPAAFAGLLELIRSKYPTGTQYTANGTHTFAGGSKVFAAVIVAGGAGGGGNNGGGAGSGAQVGGGGGGGEIVYVFGKIAAATAAITAGTGGAGGGSSAAGSAGSASSIVHNGTTVSADGGHQGSVNIRGGAGGSTDAITGMNAVFVTIRIPGPTGGTGCVTSVTYNGAGAVSGYGTSAGLGGLIGFGGRGSGGDGAGIGGSSAAGSAGAVTVYEG